MACSDCFNGCGTPTSDKCVKYTGVDYNDLDIENGDSLFSLEDKIILKILDIMIGEAIAPTIDPLILCDQVKAYMPIAPPYNLNDYLIAIIKVACDNGTDIEDLSDKMTALNSVYTMNCIAGVVNDDDTHEVLQATIDFVCALNNNFNAVAASLPTTYVKKADLNGYIDQYIATHAPGNLISNKMVANTVVEYYGPLSNFSASGSGLDLTTTTGENWLKVYLCNGANGTPDKRGRVPIGVTNVPGGVSFSPDNDPTNPDNHTYVYKVAYGTSTTTLTLAQIPSHNHTGTVTITETPHTHFVASDGVSGGLSPTNYINYRALLSNSNENYNLQGVPGVAFQGLTSPKSTGATATVTINPNGANGGHSNIQPTLPCYYIMYIP